MTPLLLNPGTKASSTHQASVCLPDYHSILHACTFFLIIRALGYNSKLGSIKGHPTQPLGPGRYSKLFIWSCY